MNKLLDSLEMIKSSELFEVRRQAEENNLSDNVLKVSRESKDLVMNDENRDFVKSLLEILELNETKSAFV